MEPHNGQRQSRLYSFILHILGLTSFVLSFRFLFSLSTIFSNSFGGRFQHFTNLSLLFSTITFALGLYADLTASSSITRVKNWLLSFITPMEIVVTLSYWSILFYKPSLILDSRSWGQPPLLTDMGFHLFPAVFLCIDSIFLTPLSEISKWQALGVIEGCITAYWGWVTLCFRKNGFWVYPLLGKTGVIEKVGGFSIWAVVIWGAWVGVEWAKWWVQRAEQEERGTGTEKKVK